MSTRILYRYDDDDYANGTPILPRGDSIYAITPDRKAAEDAIRVAVTDGADIRSNSIYTWENEVLARRLWKISGKKFLYELEVDEVHVRFRGDLNHYSAAVDATKSGASLDEHVESYWSGQEAGAPWTEPRIEVLVSQARVLRKLEKL